MNRPREASNIYGLPTMMQLRSDRVIGFHAFRHSQKHLNFLKEKLKSDKVRSKAYNGRLSYGAKKRLTKAAQIMACVSPQRRLVHPVTQSFFNFRLAFVTLTFPVQLSAEDEKCAPITFLKPMLQHLVRRYEVKNYVWRAELTKANRLHFHIIIDQPIHYVHVRNFWNKLMRKAGLLHAFAKVNGHFNAPSTDIRKIKNLKQALRYTSKYMSKDNLKQRPLKCKVWDCSMFLKSAQWSTLEVGQECWADIIQNLTGNEEGVVIAERFFVVANRYLKGVSSVKNWLLREVHLWVERMRVACGWLDVQFTHLARVVEAPQVVAFSPPVTNFEFQQLSLVFEN